MIAVLVLIVITSASLAVAYGERTKRITELAAVNKVGKWYEHRVAELEHENQQLAGQVIASGAAVHPIAMPLPGPAEYVEYASDPTGIVVERLDPRDTPVS